MLKGGRWIESDETNLAVCVSHPDGVIICYHLPPICPSHLFNERMGPLLGWAYRLWSQRSLPTPRHIICTSIDYGCHVNSSVDSDEIMSLLRYLHPKGVVQNKLGAWILMQQLAVCCDRREKKWWQWRWWVKLYGNVSPGCFVPIVCSVPWAIHCLWTTIIITCFILVLIIRLCSSSRQSWHWYHNPQWHYLHLHLAHCSDQHYSKFLLAKRLPYV